MNNTVQIGTIRGNEEEVKEQKFTQDIDHSIVEFMLDRANDILTEIRTDIKGKRLRDFTEADRHAYTKNVRLTGTLLTDVLTYLWHEYDDHVIIDEYEKT